MKKIILIMAAIMASVIPVKAAEVAYNQKFVNQVVTTTTSFILDMNAYGADAISFEAVVSSSTIAIKTFNDGHISSGTVTVASATALSATASSATVIVTTNSALSLTAGSNSMLVSTSATGWSGIAGSSFTIVTASSVTLVMGVQISTNVVSSSATATAIATAINTYVRNVTATVSGSSVIVTCNMAGSFCNNYAMNSTTNTLTVASAKFTGGADNVSFTITGQNNSFVFLQGQQWTQQSVASNTAISIMNAVNAVPGYLSASTSTAISVTIALATKGTFGNAYTLAASSGALTVPTATFKGGQDNAVFCLNGTCLTQGTDYTAGSSSATAANALSAAINANASLTGLVTSTAPLACGLSSPCGVVYATGTILTSGNFNYRMYTSTTALTLSSTTLLAGTTSAYQLNTASITIPLHGYANGMLVGFSTGSAVSLGGLTNQTSYYVIVKNTDTIQMALTSTGAFAGTYITLTSSSTTGPHNFSFTPAAVTGSAVLSWSQSNDGVNFSSAAVTSTNVTITTMTVNTPWSPTYYGWDFGNVNYRYLRLTVTGPATEGNGGFNTVVTGYGKRYWR